MKRFVRIILAALLVLSLAGLAACGPKVDYKNAEAVEKALRAGEKLDGKIVKVKINKVEKTELGWSARAGEKLSFFSVTDPMIKDGSTITVRIDTIVNLLGTYVITYTKV